MDLLVSPVFMMLTGCLWNIEARNYTTVLTVPNGARWGDWGKPELCEKGYADGFSLKVQSYQGSMAWHDDTSLNAIRLHCSDGQTITSKVGPWGEWTNPEFCPRGHLIAFSFKVQGELGPVVDDSGGSNLRFNCDGGSVLTGRSQEWGNFGPWSSSCTAGGICGLQTKVEDDQGSGDDTALNDVKFFCCD